MSLWYLVLLAVVQGLTEFLPISSSAHLILLPWLVDVPDQGLAFDVAANTGTLAAVVVYFRSDLGRLAGAWLRPTAASAHERRLFLHLAIASVPVLVVGFLVRDLIATLARQATVIAATSIGFGVLLALADRLGGRARARSDMTGRDALRIGAAQALALVPGVSRSGVTMTAGLFCNLSREEAARFSFLLAIPVSAAAGGYEALGLLSTGVSARLLFELSIVLAVSGLTALVVIHLFLGFVRTRSLTGFVVYRIALGVAILWVTR